MSHIRSRGSARILVLLALVAAATGAGVALERNGAIGQQPGKEINPTALRHAEALSEAFHNAAEVAMPSVVTIRSKTKAQPIARGRGNLPRGENPFKGTPFEDMFEGRDFGELNPRQAPRQGVGSGVIIDASGLVLTNNHVVAGADEVVVRLADGREFKAEDIKTDEQTDLAVVRIRDAGSLPAAKLGDSDKMRIGDWVIAIGNPFEYEQTVSSGIISGMGRELGSIRRAKFIQTDAAINPGNSGGPLVNLHGEIVGINTAIASNNGSFNGIGFAIPINLAKWVTGQLIKQGSVQRAYLGVGIGDMNADLAERFGVRAGEGVLVSQVYPGTPAADAGFEPGDVVTHFDGHAVKNARELQELVERVPLDSKQKVDVLRDGKKLSLTVVAKALPKEFGVASNPLGGRGQRSGDEPKTYDSDSLGVTVADLEEEQAEAFGLKAGEGVLLTDVDPSKPAYDAGLRAGMVIQKVGKKPVASVEQFKDAMKGESIEDGVVLYVKNRAGNSTFVLVKP